MQRIELTFGDVEFGLVEHASGRWEIEFAYMGGFVGRMDYRFRYLEELYTRETYSTLNEAMDFIRRTMNLPFLPNDQYRLVIHGRSYSLVAV